MKLLLFKISSCEQCQMQEKILKENNIDYIPCELFKNRQLARRYGVTDVPCCIIVDDENMAIKKYNHLNNDKELEKIRKILQKM